jgi:hypothetical protein
MAGSASGHSTSNSKAKTTYRLELALMNQKSCQAHNGPLEVSNGKVFIAERGKASIL